jgi:hypothetical protein
LFLNRQSAPWSGSSRDNSINVSHASLSLSLLCNMYFIIIIIIIIEEDQLMRKCRRVTRVELYSELITDCTSLGFLHHGWWSLCLYTMYFYSWTVELCCIGINRAAGSAGTAMLDEDQESRRASSRGIIPRAKIKTVKMTFVIVFGKFFYF